MDIQSCWPTLVEIVNQGLKTNGYVSLATTNPEGTPHITPIGSLILQPDCRGFYCEEFPRQLPRNLEHSQKICVLAVNSGIIYRYKSLIKGSFSTWPGVRLYGTAGPKRKGSAEEIAQWLDRVRLFRRLKGYKLLWEPIKWVRDLHFDRFQPILTGRMTQGIGF